MSVVYVEARPKSEKPVTHYVVEDRADNELHRTDTQEAAITWAKARYDTVHVARVRVTDKGNPDHWRKA